MPLYTDFPVPKQTMALQQVDAGTEYVCRRGTKRSANYNLPGPPKVKCRQNYHRSYCVTTAHVFVGFMHAQLEAHNRGSHRRAAAPDLIVPG